MGQWGGTAWAGWERSALVGPGSLWYNACAVRAGAGWTGCPGRREKGEHTLALVA